MENSSNKYSLIISTLNQQNMRILFLTAILAFLNMHSHAQGIDASQTDWFDNKYSMFIHFGVYSELGGVWKGEPVKVGYSEQIQAHGGIMSDVYEETAARFNPGKWDADSIALLAKEAGMRSIVITAKHHDGFCMYDTKTTRFSITGATSFKRDVLKELSDACKRHGLNMGLYFSLIDWTVHPWTSHNANLISDAHHELNKKQVTEILTNYGPISELWFDMGSLTDRQSLEIYQLVKKLQPECMVSGRLGNNRYDFCVMGDNEYPGFKIDAPWQTPASIFDETWGYRSWQVRENPEAKIREKLVSLIKVVSHGGNYLLNIGPKGDGTVVPYEATVLKGIGKWLKQNGEAIYGTTANPFPESYPWGEITAKGDTLYLILSGEPTQTIELPLFSGKVESASMLGMPDHKIRVRNRRNVSVITLPLAASQRDGIRVVAVTMSKGYLPDPGDIIDPGLTFLGPDNATPHYSYACIDYYNNHRSLVRQSWNFTSSQRDANPEIFFTEGERGRELELIWNGVSEIIKLEGTAVPNINGTMEVGVSQPWLLTPVRSQFERVHGPVSPAIDPAKPWNRNLQWTKLENWRDREEITMEALPRQSFYVLQELEAPVDMDYIVHLYSGDGIQVWLNGVQLSIHNHARDSQLNRDVFLLSLKEGKNQVLVKYYNRYGYSITWKTNLKPEQTIYSMPLQPRQFNKRDMQKLEMRPYKPETPHEPMRSQNIRIEL